MNKNLDNWAISVEMYEWICNNIPKGSTILEFGSGTGTIELTKHYTVYSVEQNPKFIGLAEKSNYIHAPIKNQWYDSEIVFDNIPNQYSLLLVDGPLGSQFRNNIKHHWDKLNTDVPIIMDDTHRESELNFAKETAKTLNKDLKIIDGWQKTFGLLT